MRFTKFDQLSLEAELEEDDLIAADTDWPTNSKVTDDDYIDEEFPVYASAVEAVKNYFEDNSEPYREVQQLREESRENSKFEEHSNEQRSYTQQDSEKRAEQLNKKMRVIAKGIQRKTNAFTIKSETERTRILDLCTSHGPFLAFALEKNPTAHAVSFNLALDQGGLPSVVEESETFEVHMRDINTLIADMGLWRYEIKGHRYLKESDYTPFFRDGLKFDLVLCDGPFLSTQKTYRQPRQSRRLLLTQLAIGLEHCRVGGTMIVMLRKLEWLETIRLWLDFKGFAKVDFFKPRWVDAEKPYFYLVASDIKDTSNDAAKAATEAVEAWKREWKVATLDDAKKWTRQKNHLAGFGELGIDGVLEEYGPELVQLGRYIWKREANGLRTAAYIDT